MPLSNNAFDSANILNNPKLLDFLRRNKKAYTEKELKRRFGADVGWQLTTLVFTGDLDVKFIGGDLYYRAKKRK